MPDKKRDDDDGDDGNDGDHYDEEDGNGQPAEENRPCIPPLVEEPTEEEEEKPSTADSTEDLHAETSAFAGINVQSWLINFTLS